MIKASNVLICIAVCGHSWYIGHARVEDNFGGETPEHIYRLRSYIDYIEHCRGANITRGYHRGEMTIVLRPTTMRRGQSFVRPTMDICIYSNIYIYIYIYIYRPHWTHPVVDRLEARTWKLICYHICLSMQLKSLS